MLNCNLVLGGGLSGAYPLFIEAVIEEMEGTFYRPWEGRETPRLVAQVLDLEKEAGQQGFQAQVVKSCVVPQSKREVPYRSRHVLGIAKTRLGTSEAVFSGAYEYALDALGLRNSRSG